MPGEEMEITTDLGHPGFGEDIDIDLDFAVGPPDEDLELADFDQAQDMQNFNSDTRDELMAEGDDASYGMIDADDIGHNQAAATANDIEIDLGDSEENMWHSHVARDESFENIAEFDYVEGSNAENVATGEGNYPEAPAANHGTDLVDHVDAELAQDNVPATSTAYDNVLQESAVLSSGVESKDFGSPHAGDSHVDTASIRVHGNTSDNVVGGAYDKDPDTVFDVDFQQTAEKFITPEPNEGEDSATKPNIDVSQDGNVHQAHGEVEVPVSHNGELGSGLSGHDQGSDVAEQGQEIEQEQEHKGSVTSEHGSLKEPFPQQEQAEQNHVVSNHNSPEQPLGDDTYVEPANDQPSEGQGPTERQSPHSHAGEAYSQRETSVPGIEDLDGVAGITEEESTENGANHAEHLASVAARYEMFISYGQTDYRLFAKSEDDDPNQYFLSDISALELPLSQFLSSLRDVISEEVSPLDELVMHVDGLGLEFSESSTSDMLEKFTFGNILSLFDRLVQNDGEESLPDLYTYLMVRPNCHQRLVALLAGAESGRGLSEVAVYREATPFDDEPADEPDSKVPAVTLDDNKEEDEVYEDEQDDNTEKDDTVESPVERERGPGVDSVAKLTTEEPVQHAEQSAASTGTGADAEAEDDLIDYSDDELDLTPTKQGKALTPLNSPSFFSCTRKCGCQCDVCFEVELEQLDASWRLNKSKFASPNNFAEAPQNSYSLQQNPDQSGTGCQAASNVQGVPLSNFQAFENPTAVANAYISQDDSATASPHNNAHDVEDQANHINATENGGSNEHREPTSVPVDAPNSDNTSVTATLDSDDRDEIDYSDDEGVETQGGDNGASEEGTHNTENLTLPVDDEITWESDNEDVEGERIIASSKQTVQVSPTSGKRSRSDSDGLDGATEENDVKRRRS
ncbi:hypothetical protein F4779DRAFT_612824 [Xylariaceae sp. FL0662B]|nr:hypothetical protein F4779DRAFT_612824 [Xylariaceae sp. FL0662B]